MNLHTIIDKYMGWCPHFEKVSVQQTPLADLTINGKMVFSTLLASTGLLAIIVPLILLVQSGPYYFDTMSETLTIIIWGLGLASGIIIIALLVDFILFKKIERRQRIEAGIIAILWAAGLLLSLGLYLDPRQGVLLAQDVGLILREVISAAFFLYVAYRLLSNKKLLVKQIFLLLSFYFVTVLIYPNILYIINAEWLQNVTYIEKFGVASELIAYAVAAFFFFRTYLDARSRIRFDIKPPRYVMASLFFYGLSQTVLGLLYMFVKPSTLTFEGLIGVGYNLSSVVALIQAVTFLLFSFYPIKLNVGEELAIANSSGLGQ